MIDRRTFLKSAAVGALATGLNVITVKKTAAETGPGTILGTGEHRYEWIDSWAKLPMGRTFGKTHAVIEDAEGRIFIHHMSEDKDSVYIFDPQGVFITSWGRDIAEGAHGMELRNEGGQEFLYLCTTWLHEVMKTTLDGEIVWRMKFPKESGLYRGPGAFAPTNLAFAPNGDFYVADGYGMNFIHHYTADKELIRSWGGKGTDPGKFKTPHGIWVDTRGQKPEVVVADRGHHQLQYFSLDGRYRRTVKSGLFNPCHFAQRGEHLLIPDLNGRVTILDGRNAILTHLGVYPKVRQRPNYPNLSPEDTIPGQFISPHGAMWDRAGNIFVTEWMENGRVTKLRRVS